MRCKHCNAKLAEHDIWCVNCGRQTSLPQTELSACSSLKQTWSQFSGPKSRSVPAAGLSVLLGLIPIAALIVLFNSYIDLPATTGLQTVLSLLVKALAYSVFLPFVLVGINAASTTNSHTVELSAWKKSMSAYPRYFMFSLISALYYALIYIVCIGLPKFGSDPILRLVWIVLMNYWVAIALPALVLMEIKELSPLSALRLSYRHFHDLRWNIWLMGLILLVLNAVAFALFLIGLVVTIPFSWFAIRDYTRRLVDFELLEYRR